MKQEDSLDFKQTFNIDFSDVPQLEHSQKSNKSKYIKLGLLIFATIAIITAVALLVGHFQYALFQSKIGEAISIKREMFTTEYFTETKTIKSKLSYTSGELNERVQNVKTNFAVMLTDKEPLPKDDFLYTAYIVLLQSNVELEGQQAPLNSFDISDEKVIKEFEQNPNSGKYPMAVFRFYESGVLKDINVPKDMDKTDAQNIIDLINNVIPKLKRNPEEDKEDGLEIKTRTGKKKKTYVEYQPPKEYVDKYTKAQFKGSKITKTVERDVEDEKITEIRTNTNLFLETQKEEQDYIDFGIKDFYYDTASVIVATETDENKEKINLVKGLFSKLELMDGETLIVTKMEQEREEQNKEVEKQVEEDATISPNELRKLGWDGSFGWDWELASSNILGQSVKVVYSISLKSGSVKNKIVLKFNNYELPLGNKDGASSNKSQGKKEAGEKEVGRIALAGPAVTLSVKIGGKLSFDVNYASSVFTLKLNGEVYAKAGVCLGLKNVAEIEVGVKGTLITCDFITKIKRNSNGTYSKQSISIVARAGVVSVYAKGTLLGCITLFSETFEVWKGWPVVNKTW